MAQYVQHVNLDFEHQMFHCDTFLLENRVINLSTEAEWKALGMLADTITVRDPAKIPEAKKYAPYAQTIIILDEMGGRFYDATNHYPVNVNNYRPWQNGKAYVC